LNLLLTGATGQIGYFLLQHLTHENVTITAVSRQPHTSSAGEQWIICDLLHEDPFTQVGHIDVWVHAGILTLSVPWLTSASQSGVKHVITFSSTSIFTKLNSSSQKECVLMDRIRHAERELAEQCEHLSMHWNILRPTLIYGRGTDQNITFITNMIQRFGFFPMVGDGKALRQPVHAEDLAKAAWSLVTSDHALNRAYNLSGGEVLTYQELVTRIFTSLQRPIRILRVPPILYKCMIIIMKKLNHRYAFIQTSMVDRMAMDMTFDHSDAQKDLGYQPRDFQL